VNHTQQQELQLNQLTMIDLSYIIPDMKTDTDNKIEVHNPYSGQSAMLTEEENKLYLSIKLAEIEERYDIMQKQLDKFSRLNAKAYMVLLD